MAYLGQKQLQLVGRLPSDRGLVFALNLATDEVGGQQFRNGRYSFVVPAQPGDPIELWYVVGRDQSELHRFLAPQYPPVSDGDSGDSGDSGGSGGSGGQAGADAGPAIGSGDADATGAGARALDAATDAF